MTTIIADFSKMVKQDTNCAAAFTKLYSVHKGNEGMYVKALSLNTDGRSNLCEPLQSCLRVLAAAEYLTIEFGDPNKQTTFGARITISVSLACWISKCLLDHAITAMPTTIVQLQACIFPAIWLILVYAYYIILGQSSWVLRVSSLSMDNHVIAMIMMCVMTCMQLISCNKL